MRFRRALVAVTLLLLAACGRGDPNASAARPAEVPVALVPAELGGLSFAEDKSSTEAFAKLGDEALISDGRLWAIRKGETLVATLQISTVKDDVDVTVAEDRDAIARNILPGAGATIDVEGVPVLAATANDKTVYLWFAAGLFEVLQIKTTDLDAETILGDILRFQTTSESWEPIPDEDFVEEGEVLE